uniref:At5g61270 n=1 Tax=Arabidopsis thaliana TaxID=3702 RepID=Q8GUI3_ARATH|nr:Unknown protein [Arabidopsis thaliana]AAP37793.1 At5g61270 [Arabidopsis thaliana]
MLGAVTSAAGPSNVHLHLRQHPPRGVGAPPPPGLEPTLLGQPSSGRLMCVKVRLLDDTVAVFHLGNKALGQTLFDEVCRHLNLLECDYFGLEFIDQQGGHIWLDKDKPILRQVAAAHSDAKFYFVVKFYTPSPTELEEEYTRYLFSLQIRRDLANGDLLCAESTAALLAAYLVQAECGDWSAHDYPDASYLNGARFVPAQTSNFQQMVAHNHSKLVGMSPGESDLSLLEVARRCDFFGIKFHPARDVEGVRAHLAVVHLGIKVFHQLHCVATFSWAKIRKLSFKRRKLLLKLHADQSEFSTVEFTFESRNECKNFWKKCVEHHAFFRCAQVIETNGSRSASSGPSARRLGGGGGDGKLFGNTRGSSFRYHGRTQKQLIEYIRDYHKKREPFARPLKPEYNTYQQHSARAAAPHHHHHHHHRQPAKELDATTSEADRQRVVAQQMLHHQARQSSHHHEHERCCQHSGGTRARQARSLPRRAPLNPLDDVAPACPPTWLDGDDCAVSCCENGHRQTSHRNNNGRTPALGVTGGGGTHTPRSSQPPAYSAYFSKQQQQQQQQKRNSPSPMGANRLSMTDTVVSKSLPDVAVVEPHRNNTDTETDEKRGALSAGPSGERLDEKQTTLTDDNISCDSYQLADHERCTRSEVGTAGSVPPGNGTAVQGLSAAQRRLRNRSAIAAKAVHEAAARAVQIDGPRTIGTTVNSDYATLETIDSGRRPVVYTPSGKLLIRPTVISSGDDDEQQRHQQGAKELVVVVEQEPADERGSMVKKEIIAAITTGGPLPGRILTTDELMITPDGIRAKSEPQKKTRPSSALLTEGPVVDLAERLANEAAQQALQEARCEQERPKRPQLISVQSVDQPDIEHQLLLDDPADEVPYTLTMRKLDAAAPASTTSAPLAPPPPPPRSDRSSAPRRLFEDECRARVGVEEEPCKRLRRRVSLDLVARRRLPSPASFSSQDHSLSPCTPDAGDLFEYIAMMRRRSASNERVAAATGAIPSSSSRRNDARRRTQPVRFELPDMMEESCTAPKLTAESTPQLSAPAEEKRSDEKKECRESADSDDVPLPPPPPPTTASAVTSKRGPPPAVPSKPVGLMRILPGGTGLPPPRQQQSQQQGETMPNNAEDLPFVDEQTAPSPVKGGEGKGDPKKPPSELMWTDF